MHPYYRAKEAVVPVFVFEESIYDLPWSFRSSKWRLNG